MHDFLALFLKSTAALLAGTIFATITPHVPPAPLVPDSPRLVSVATEESPAEGARADAATSTAPEAETDEDPGLFASPAPFSAESQDSIHEDDLSSSLLERAAAVAAAFLESSGSSTPLVFPYPEDVDDSALKAAVVNIICLSRVPGLPSMTGSGVVVDPEGIILTNAHVGKYFVLSKYLESGELNCTIRGGNPARSLYKAEIFYISSSWVKNSAEGTEEDRVRGTGESDFALLRIAETLSGTDLPEEFPYLSYSIDGGLSMDRPVVITGYPAEFIPDTDISRKLYALSAPTKLTKAYTFTETTIDLVSMYGTFLAQRGTSGGALVNDQGELAGIIVTASAKFYEGSRRLQAITIGHIDRTIEKETGQSLSELLSGNLSRKALQFQNTDAPELESMLEEVIEESLEEEA